MSDCTCGGRPDEIGGADHRPGCGEPPSKWVVHIEGPDDVHEFDDDMQADAFAEQQQAALDEIKRTRKPSPYWPNISVRVYSPEEWVAYGERVLAGTEGTEHQ